MGKYKIINPRIEKAVRLLFDSDCEFQKALDESAEDSSISGNGNSFTPYIGITYAWMSEVNNSFPLEITIPSAVVMPVDEPKVA